MCVAVDVVERSVFFRGEGGGHQVSRASSGQLQVVAGPKQFCLLSHQASRNVGRLLLVCVIVFHHPVLADESLSAYVTCERLLACVQTHVSS